MQLRYLGVIHVDNAGEGIERELVEVIEVSAALGAEVEGDAERLYRLQAACPSTETSLPNGRPL
jgi:hypothetical protein